MEDVENLTPSSLTFEESLKKLEGTIRELERGQATLDDSLLYYQKGIEYLRHCYQLLNAAEEKLEVLFKDTNGNFVKKEIEHLQDLGKMQF